MLIKEFIVIICLANLASSVPYQYPGFTTMSSTPSYVMKQNFNSDSPAKYNVGYKVQDSGTTKVKKEFSNSEYQNIFAPDSVKRPYSGNEFSSFDEGYSTPAAPLSPYPYPGQLKINFLPNGYSLPKQQPQYSPDSATNKIFHHDLHHDLHHDTHHDKPLHLVHDLVGHYITDVASHKLKHVGETLESGVLTEPIIHKLSFAKAALLQLLAIIGPLSAIKTVHFVAKASDPHPHPHPHPYQPEPEPIEPGYVPSAPVPLPDEIAEYGHPHYPPTLVGLILNFMAQLSKFNTDAKLHLIPNLLRVVSRTSSASAYASGKHPH